MYDVSETRFTFYVSRNGVFLLPVTSGLFVCWRHTYTEASPAPRSNGLACVNDTEYFQLVLLIKFLLTLLPSVGDSRPTVRSQKGEFAFLLARGKSVVSTNIF